MTHRRLIAALATALATVAMAACGGTGDDASSNAGAGTISLLVPEYSEKTEAFWRDLVSRFEAANPGAEVELQTVSWTDINQKITTLVSTGQQPDVLNIDAYANFAGDHLLLPAAKVLSARTRADFLPKFAENGRFDGVQYGIPFVGSVRGLFYNRDIFRRAGISGPPRTWAELRADALKIKALGEVGYGMPLGPEEAQAEFSLYAWGNGGGWKDGDRWTVNSPQNTRALEFLDGLANRDRVTQPNPASTNRTDLWKVFGAGKVGMVMGSNFYPVLLRAQNPKLSYGVAPMPTTGSHPPITLGVEDYLMAFRSSKHPDIVRKFLDYLFRPANYGKFIAREGFLPVTRSVSKAVAAKDRRQRVFIASVDTARFYPTTDPVWGAIAPKVKQDLGSAVSGRKSPKEVLDALQRSAERGR